MHCALQGARDCTVLDKKYKGLWFNTLLKAFNPTNTKAICSKKLTTGASSIYVFYLKWTLLHTKQFWHKIALFHVMLKNVFIA